MLTLVLLPILLLVMLPSKSLKLNLMLTVSDDKETFFDVDYFVFELLQLPFHYFCSFSWPWPCDEFI